MALTNSLNNEFLGSFIFFLPALLKPWHGNPANIKSILSLYFKNYSSLMEGFNEYASIDINEKKVLQYRLGIGHTGIEDDKSCFKYLIDDSKDMEI